MLLVLDKQQGKVSAVKEFDKGGNLQTVPPIQGGEFVQVNRNGDIISNLVANFYRKFQDTEGLALFRCKASEVAFQHLVSNLLIYSHICLKSLGNFAKNSE